MCIISSPNAGDENPQILDELLNAGALLDTQDENGWTALMVAARKDVTSAVGVLLTAGARVELQVSYSTVDSPYAFVHTLPIIDATVPYMHLVHTLVYHKGYLHQGTCAVP